MRGGGVQLLSEYNHLDDFDKVFISKAFADTPIDERVLNLPNVVYGGTGFYMEKAPPLQPEIEHAMPDYHLYDEFVESQIRKGKSASKYKYYTDYSIGFLTRGCFRKCSFCVNQKYDRVFQNSPLCEFVDNSRKKICLLDDNFLGYRDWKYLLQCLIDTGKPFRFHQGLDERLLTDEKCKMLFGAKYDGEITFAFDNVKDYELIEQKLKLIRCYTDKSVRFYVLCGFDRENRYDDIFWKQDLYDTFKRIQLLMKYKSIPYIMRFNKYVESPYRGIYVTLSRWCNQPSMFKTNSLNEFALRDNEYKKSGECSSMRYLRQVQNDLPDLAYQYFNMKWQ